MPTARAAATPGLHVEDSADSEFERVLRIGNPGAALRRALTFAPTADLSAEEWLSAWEIWQTDVFAPKLAPALVAVVNHSSLGAAREIRSIDDGLNAVLTFDQAERSILAGQRLLAQLAGTRGERFLTKLRAWSEAGTLSAHFPTIYATQGALFHLSLRLLLLGYAYWEWTAAMQTTPSLGRRLPSFAEAAPALQTIIQSILVSPFHAAPALSPAFGAS